MAGEGPTPAIREGDYVLVRGRVEKLYGAEGLAEITFSEWWPRWSAVLVKDGQIEGRSSVQQLDRPQNVNLQNPGGVL